MSIVVSYEQQPPRRPTYASTAQKHPKLEMPQDMKHYEALLAITQALGMRHPKPRSLQPHPEMRQGFSLFLSTDIRNVPMLTTLEMSPFRRKGNVRF
jgi:hypothetical protein